MHKTDIIKAIANETGLSQKDSGAAAEAFLKAVTKAHDNAMSVSLSEQLDYERDTQRIFLDRSEYKEGVMAFIEKRKPNFRDLKEN